MKLNVLPARTGMVWVKLGVQTFVKQPLALVGMFFMMLAGTTVLSLLPWVGSVLALALIPAATVGLMAATLDASQGKFPMPMRLLVAWRESPDKGRNMAVLGGLYAGACVLVFLVASLFDSEDFSKMASGRTPVSPEQVVQSGFLWSLSIRAILYMPVSMLFWHAPALVHWQRVAPLQSIFYSWVACWRNFSTFTVYSLVWMGVIVVSSLAATMLLAVLGSTSAMMVVLPTLGMLLSAVFFTSIYFSFKDCFDFSESPQP